MTWQCIASVALGLLGLACGDAGIRIGSGISEADGGGGSGCLDPGLLVHLAFDESTGLAAEDSAVLGANGALVNMGIDDWVAGRSGNALDFDGTDGHVVISATDSIGDLGTMTMCAWVFPRAYPNQFLTIADKSDNTYVGGWNFYLENDATVGLLTNQQKYATVEGIVLNTWQHVCASWDGSSGVGGIVLYLNGSDRGQTDSGSNGTGVDSDADKDLVIGLVNNGAFPFDGLIDDYRLYDRVLSESEIEQIYQCTNGSP